MAKISLAKLLKTKSRLASLMSRTAQEVVKFNSVVRGTPTTDVRKVLDRHTEQMNAMIVLKNTRHVANQQIVPLLNRLAELKSRLSWMQGVSTVDGPVPSYRTTEPVMYVAVLKKEDMAKIVREHEIEIDKLQDEIDTYNALTQVEVPDLIMEMVKQ